jgi:membrane protein implicated in regulation of membrane protease activity
MNFSNEFWDPTVIWFIVGLVILVLELAVPGLILFFFGVGAWLVALLTLLFDISINAQLLIFFITSVILLFSLRKWVRQLFTGKMGISKNDDESSGDMVGERATVVEAIIPPSKGRVEIHGTNWTAESDIEIQAGEIVEIIGKKNLTLRVKKIN